MKQTAGAFGRGGVGGLTFMQQARQDRLLKERRQQERERLFNEERQDWIALMESGKEISLEVPDTFGSELGVAVRKIKRLLELAQSDDRFTWVRYKNGYETKRLRCWMKNQVAKGLTEKS